MASMLVRGAYLHAGVNPGFALLPRRGGAHRPGEVLGALRRRPRRGGPSQICYCLRGVIIHHHDHTQIPIVG